MIVIFGKPTSRFELFGIFAPEFKGAVYRSDWYGDEIAFGDIDTVDQLPSRGSDGRRDWYNVVLYGLRKKIRLNFLAQLWSDRLRALFDPREGEFGGPRALQRRGMGT